MFAKVICGILLSLLVCTSALAEDLTPGKRQEILRLVEAMGGKELIQQYVRQNISLVKKFRPDIPADKLPVVEREISSFMIEKISAPGGLAEQLLPVFAKRFTPQEMRELLAFYESPVGQKAVTVMPSAMREAKNVAQQMGISLIPEMNRRVNEALQRDADAKVTVQ